MKISHSAFTLVELLVVITIIGLISSAALLVLKDTTEVKALSYTKKVMTSIKKGIAEIDSDGYLRGFVNDFGTMPPHLYFLIAKKDDNNSFNYVDEALINNRFISMTKQNGTRFPAPFMSDCTASASECKDVDITNIDKVLYVGYRGGYINGEDSLKDGWQTDMDMQNDMNISENGGAKENFLTLITAGSDRVLSSGGDLLIRKEFDFAQESGSIESVYADDYNKTYRKNSFLVSSLAIDIDLKANDANEVAIFIYSPMIYYADGSDGETCYEGNATHALCNGNDRKYVAYYSFDHNFTKDEADKNVSWHIGLMKQELYFNDQNRSRLFINQKGILDSSNDTLAYDFNATTDNNITDSIFFGNISVDINNTNYNSADKDRDNPFYIYAGTKIISIWDNNGSGWKKQESFSKDFRPNARNTIKNAGN